MSSNCIRIAFAFDNILKMAEDDEKPVDPTDIISYDCFITSTLEPNANALESKIFAVHKNSKLHGFLEHMDVDRTQKLAQIDLGERCFVDAILIKNNSSSIVDTGIMGFLVE